MSKTTTAPHGGITSGRGRRRRATRGLVASYIHEVSLRERGRSAGPLPVSSPAAWAPAIAEARCAA
jgi:hypothetical protein